MDYRLVVLSHGPDFDFLERTMASFSKMVEPRPVDSVLVVDGPHQPPIDVFNDHFDLAVGIGPEQKGFCQATAAAWEECARYEDVDWVFYLEHDFLFPFKLDLRSLQAVMLANPHLVQMSLKRQAVNSEEEAAGGYMKVAPYHTDYVEISERLYWQREDFFINDELHWIETPRNWTTNPSLFRTKFAREHPWPAHVPQCEGVFGIELRKIDPGLRFGIWGKIDDLPRVNHIGHFGTGVGY